MRKALLIFLALLACASAVLAQARSRVKVGVSLPLTGSAATYGRDIKNALQFAAGYYGPDRYELVIEDDRCDPAAAVTIAQKLVRVDKVPYFVGYACSGALLSAAPIFNRAKTPVVGVFTSSPKVTEAGDYVFRTIPSDASAVRALYQYIGQHYRRVGGLFEETQFAQDFRAAFADENRGGRIEFASDNFFSGSADFRTQLLRLKGSGAEALALITLGERELIALVQQTRALDWAVPILAHVNPGSPIFLQAVGAAAEGIVFTDLPDINTVLSEKGQGMYAKFIRDYGEPQSTSMSFVASLAAFAALDRAVQAGGDVREFLAHRTFSSVLNNYHFDENGDIVGLEFVLKTIRGGKPVMLQ